MKKAFQRLKTPGSAHFFKTIGRALNPVAYEDLSFRLFKNCFKYLFLFLLVTFLLATVISIPKLAALPGQVASELDKFATFNVNITTSMTDQANLLPDNQFLHIDTRSAEANMTEDRSLFKTLITSDYLYTKKLYLNKVSRVELAPYKDVTANKEKISKLLSWLLLLLIPSLLIFGYMIYAIKYIILILAASVLALIAVRLARFDISFSQLFKIALFATTPLIIIEILLLPFNIDTYYLQYFVYIAFLVIGIAISGSFEKGKKPRRKREGYVELKID